MLPRRLNEYNTTSESIVGKPGQQQLQHDSMASDSPPTRWQSGEVLAPVRSKSDSVAANLVQACAPSPHSRPRRAPPIHRSTAPPCSGGLDQRTPSNRGTVENGDTSKRWLWSHGSLSSSSSSSPFPASRQGTQAGLGDGGTGASGISMADTSSAYSPLLPAEGCPQPAQTGLRPLMYRLGSRRYRSSRAVAFWTALICILLIILYAPLPDDGLEHSISVSPMPSKLQQSLGVLRNGVKSGVRQAVNQLPKPSWVSAVTDRASRNKSIKVSMLPRKANYPTHNDPEERYIGFLPHSGFDQQRSAFATALMLGKKLNRTVLVPPVWLGKQNPYKPYDQLQESWNDALHQYPSSFRISDDSRGRKSSSESPLLKPGNYSSTLNGALDAGKTLGPETMETAADCKSSDAECQKPSTTFVSLDRLVDLDAVTRITGVKLVNRWDMREKALEQLLDKGPEEFFVIHDQSYDDLSFLDDISRKLGVGAFTNQSTPPLLHSASGSRSDRSGSREVSLSALNMLSQKVLLVGSLAGTMRLQSLDPALSSIHQSLAFRSSRLITPARAMRHRLGGAYGYAGVYARIGNKTNKDRAELYLGEAWHDLVARLKIEPSVAQVMWELVRTANEKRSGSKSTPTRSSSRKKSGLKKIRLSADVLSGAPKRPLGLETGSTIFEDDTTVFSLPATTSHHRLHRRHIRGEQAPSPDLVFNQCRSNVHTDSDYLPFNTPIYLATNSPDPEGDPKLAIFFKAFPCTFIRSDFEVPSEMNGGEVVESLLELRRLVNVNDGVALGQMFEPLLDQTVVAMAMISVQAKGTLSSTFVERDLHTAYRQDRNDEQQLPAESNHGTVFGHW
ncbi:BZ3500_MvSof-1268-A1-R1_Chr1-3g02430 [Microbotryum saponariae]|uniref:BZ3500_MvSof-1268-A1-R1_Chr1-3g02430 protein n=1 Tax=Microbotryum saponariae TaxID=289078 RepID=A0A2X0KEV1_9BASI|nr:BZ3500_MvSof-1268-A1-R1_Chr1-3g02430 [Microbotryum saponariae]SCZ96217.1 BZ3501_MvSof-1269-A2-R1_Chr1-3g02033 [Microbotryum saponariae]